MRRSVGGERRRCRLGHTHSRTHPASSARALLLLLSPPPPRAPARRLLAVAFQLYDRARRGSISPADVSYLLAHSFRENGEAISDAAVDRIVADTFRQYDLNKDGLIDYAEFKHMCQLQPNVLKPLTINVSEIIAAAGFGGSA